MTKKWEIKLDKHCAYCGNYVPNSDIRDLISTEDWEQMQKYSTCNQCKEYLEQISEEEYHQMIYLIHSTLMLSSGAYQLAHSFNRVTLRDNPVVFYYEKKLKEKDDLNERLNEIFKGER